MKLRHYRAYVQVEGMQALMKSTFCGFSCAVPARRATPLLAINWYMASIVARKSVRMQLMRLCSQISSWTHSERVVPLPQREGIATRSSFRRRQVLSGSTVRFSAARREEQVVVDNKKRKKSEQEDHNDAEDGKEIDDQKQEEVESRVGEWFLLTGSCALVLHRGDITTWKKDGKTDAIVNAANEMMLGGGGVDGAIHRAAGRKLFDACIKVPEVSRGVRCPVGSAVITPGFDLPVSHIIHTVGPIYYGEEKPASTLAKAYKESLKQATKNGLKYIAFPAISCGVYGYPYDEAAEVSIQALQEDVGELLEIHFVLFEAGTYGAWLAEAKSKLKRFTA